MEGQVFDVELSLPDGYEYERLPRQVTSISILESTTVLVDWLKHYLPIFLLSARRARSILARILSASFVHSNIVGVALYFTRY